MTGEPWSSVDQVLIWCLNIMLQVGFIAALALLVSLSLRRSPAARYWLLCSALILVCMSPVISATVQSTGMNLLSVSLMPDRSIPEEMEFQQEQPSSGVTNQTGTDFSDSELWKQANIEQFRQSASARLQKKIPEDHTPQTRLASSLAVTPKTKVTVESVRKSTSYSGSMLRISLLATLIVWSSVALVLLIQLAVNWYRLSLLLRSTKPNTNVELTKTVQSAWQALGVNQGRSVPELVFSDKISGPVAAGIRTPKVILPKSLLEQIDARQLHAILIHELAHIGRGDQLVILLQNFINAVFWANPFVRMLNRQVAQAREEVCDNFVLTTTDAPTYSRTLLVLGQLLRSPQAIPGTVGLFASRWKLEQRIAGLLDERRSRKTRLGKGALFLICVITSGAALLASLGTVSLVGAETSQASQQDRSSQNSDAKPSNLSTDSAKNETDKKSKTDNANRDSHFVYSGRIVDAQGTPIDNAQIDVVYSAYQLKNPNSNEFVPLHKQLAKTHTRSDGTFQLEFDDYWTWYMRGQNLDFKSKSMTESPGTMIVVSAPGYVPKWISTSSANPDVPLNLSLSQGGPVIEGRLVNPEGRGLSGVTVSLQTLCSARQGAVTHWLQELPEQRRQGLLPSEKGPVDFNSTTGRYPISSHLIADTPGLLTQVETDHEGRFRIPDLGADRLAILVLSGPGVPTERIAVVTRDMQPVQARSMGYRGPLDDTYYGAKFTCVVEPGVVIQGTVRDLESGAPITAHLQVLRRRNHSVGEIDYRDWKTDARGRFHISKIPAVKKLILYVIPNSDQPYFAERFDLSEPAEGEPITFDVSLRRGILYHGTLTDKKTGQPIPNAYFDYFPLLDNKYAKQYRCYPDGRSRLEPMRRRFKSAEDGTFSVLGIPGKGVIAARIDDSNYLTAFGLEDVSQLIDGERLKTFDYAAYRLYKVLKPVTAVPGQKAPRIEMQAEPGISLQFEVVGPDDQPASNFWVDKRGVKEIEGKPITVHGFGPHRTRTIYFHQFEKGWGRAVTIRGIPEDRSVQKVKLVPTGTVKGQLVSTDNNPLSEAPVSLVKDVIPGTDEMPNYELGPSTLPMICDRNGKFRFGGLLVGADYNVQMVAWSGRRHFTIPDQIRVEPGQTIDLGVITVPDRK